MKYILMVILLSIPVTAHADGSAAGKHHVPPSTQAQPKSASHEQESRHNQVIRQHTAAMVRHSRRELNFYRHRDENLMDDDAVSILPVQGDVLDQIPQDYVVVPSDGINYLFIGGVYCQAQC